MSALGRLLRRVRTIADATDRWFVSLSRGLSPLSTPPQPALAPPAPDPAVNAPATDAPRPTISLLRATTVTDPVTEPAPPAADAPAGILPLLRALADVVGRHRSTDYRTLSSDDRFWGLVHLVHDLGRPATDPEALDSPFPASPNPTR